VPAVSFPRHWIEHGDYFANPRDARERVAFAVEETEAKIPIGFHKNPVPRLPIASVRALVDLAGSFS
jgi:hypothetical protein